MWHWFVVLGSKLGRRTIYSETGWDAEWKAQTNLEARINQPVADFPTMRKNEHIEDFGTEWKR